MTSEAGPPSPDLHRLRRLGHHRLGRSADQTRLRPWTRAAGTAARTFIGTMFTGTFAGQLARSAWYAVPTATSGMTTVLGIVGARR